MLKYWLWFSLMTTSPVGLYRVMRGGSFTGITVTLMRTKLSPSPESSFAVILMVSEKPDASALGLNVSTSEPMV